MKVGNKKIFLDKQRLESMLHLRRKGFSFYSIGMIYGVDHTTIFEQCRKRGLANVPTKHVFTVYQMIPITKTKPKTYTDYVEEQRMKKDKFYYLSKRWNPNDAWDNIISH